MNGKTRVIDELLLAKALGGSPDTEPIIVELSGEGYELYANFTSGEIRDFFMSGKPVFVSFPYSGDVIVARLVAVRNTTNDEVSLQAQAVDVENSYLLVAYPDGLSEDNTIWYLSGFQIYRAF